MFPQFIPEADVRARLTMPLAIDAVEQAFRRWAAGEAMNVPRARAQARGAWLHMMSAADSSLQLMAWKAYSTTARGADFHVGVYSTATGKPLALLEANHLGQIRTGATTGVATRALSRPNSSTVGLFGTGFQARTQLEAVCAVRPIRRALVYGRDPQRRGQFARTMSEHCQIEVIPAESPELAVRDCDIVITATSSRQPVFSGEWLSPGTHVNAIGSNLLSKAELDVEAVRRADRIVCDSIDQCRLEAGDFVEALQARAFFWDKVSELRTILAGSCPGRTKDEQITLFKSVGLALEDLAAAAVVLQAEPAAAKS